MPANHDKPRSDPLNSQSQWTEERDWLRGTLATIGDAVITVDLNGAVILLNPAAQVLTGWTQFEAVGVPIESVYRVVHETTRSPVENPAVHALRQGTVVALANHSLLIAKNGRERPIEECANPIHTEAGNLVGVVLVFRDCTERTRREHALEAALLFSKEIVATLREPFLVLDNDLRVVAANASFYRTFDTSESETVGHLLYTLGNGQWDVPALRTLLQLATPQIIAVEDFAVDHDFPSIGRRSMVLNTRRFPTTGGHANLVLLAIEDVT